jgi:inner membrane protein
MDSLTQAVLGAGIAGAVAPVGHRRKALLAGAALGTLPDLDVFIDYGGAVENFTFHRGFSHSLFVLIPFSMIVWWLLRRVWVPVREAPVRWLAVIGLALVTHPLLDAHTAYGTQLFWPLSVPPTMWATIFIIDPLFTLPLLLATLFAAVRPVGRFATPMLQGAIALSGAYLAWTWLAQGVVHRHTEQVLAGMELAGSPTFVTPTPFNTLLWRVVVQTREGYLEGFDSLLLDEPTIDFRSYDSDVRALAEASDVWAVARLRWFAQDFVKAEVRDGRLLVSDLRMGHEPNYVFTHVVAERANPHWRAIPTALIPVRYDRDVLTETLRRIRSH